MRKGIFLGILFLGMLFSAPTAFAQQEGCAVPQHGELLGKTREQLIRQLGKETFGDTHESLWILKQEKDTQEHQTLWIVYDRNEKAILCHVCIEKRPV